MANQCNVHVRFHAVTHVFIALFIALHVAAIYTGPYWLAVRAAIYTGGLLDHSSSSNIYGGLIGSQLEQQYIWGAYWLTVRAAIYTGGLLAHS